MQCKWLFILLFITGCSFASSGENSLHTAKRSDAGIATVKSIKPTPLVVWMFALYSADPTKNKTKPFFDYLSTQTNTTYHLTSSTNIPELLQNCRTGLPSLIIINYSLEKRIKAQCRYTTLAQTQQSVFIYARNTLTAPAIDDIKRIGFIKNATAIRIAKSELFKDSDNLEIVIYSNLYEMIQHHKQRDTDYIVLAESFIKAAPLFEKKWQPIHQFQEKGRVSFMISPLVDAKITEQIATILLGNQGITKELWQDKGGLGPFQKPND